MARDVGQRITFIERDPIPTVGRPYYVLVTRENGSPDEWIRMRYRAEYRPQYSDESLLCDLSDWR